MPALRDVIHDGKVVAVVAAAVLAVGGCGGREGAVLHSAAVTKNCLEQDGVSVRKWEHAHVGNLLPRKAPQGELIVEFEGNVASLFFDRNAADARRTRREAARFIESSVGQFDGDWHRDLVQRRENVTVSWKSTPDDCEREVLDRCLPG